jgi:hypothetical protein
MQFHRLFVGSLEHFAEKQRRICVVFGVKQTKRRVRD